MAEQVFLAVDLGAESGRVIAGRFDGERLVLEELHRFGNGPVPVAGTLRWNLIGLWSEILRGLEIARQHLGDSIVSVGVDTWGVDYVLLSRDDELIGQPYHYRDRRTEGMLNFALTRVSKPQIFGQTGLQFMEINTLYQLLATQQSRPQMLEMAESFLLVPDFFHWLLCGSRVVEFTNATTTQCFHPVKGEWSFEMLEQLGLPTQMFPEVVAPGTRLGHLREDVCKRTGLGRVEVVAPATHDTGAAVAAVPTSLTGSPKWAYISSGTWSLMGVEVQDAILSDRALALNVTNEGGVDGTYRLLKNIMGLWLVQECKRSFGRAGQDLDYSEITRQAAGAEPFRAFVDPDAAEFLSPEDMPTAIRDWCQRTGQTPPDSVGQIVRCALESLALKYRRVLGWLEELTGVPVEVIHIVGGGTQNALLNQFTANACGRTVVTGPIEATAMGNLLIQARTAGSLQSLSDIRSVVRASSSIEEFEPEQTGAWQDAYQRFLEVCDG